MYSYQEIQDALKGNTLPEELDQALQSVYKSLKVSSRLDALIAIYEISSIYESDNHDVTNILDYLRQESELIIRGMLDANQLSDLELKNLIEQRKDKRQTDPEFLPTPKPQGYTVPTYGQSQTAYAQRQLDDKTEKTERGVYRALHEHYADEKNKGYVEYLMEPEDRDHLRVFINDGQIYGFKLFDVGQADSAEEESWKNQRLSFEPYNNPDMSHIPQGARFLYQIIYVVDPQGNMYVGLGIQGEFHHSSFLGGGPVISAGEVDITDGHLNMINNMSGHYQPNEQHLASAIQYLVRRGAINDSTRVALITPETEYKPVPYNIDQIRRLTNDAISPQDPLYDLLVLQSAINVNIARLDAEYTRILNRRGKDDPRLPVIENATLNMLHIKRDLTNTLNEFKQSPPNRERVLDENIYYYTKFSKSLAHTNKQLGELPSPSFLRNILDAVLERSLRVLASCLTEKFKKRIGFSSKIETQSKTREVVDDIMQKFNEVEKYIAKTDAANPNNLEEIVSSQEISEHDKLKALANRPNINKEQLSELMKDLIENGKHEIILDFISNKSNFTSEQRGYNSLFKSKSKRSENKQENVKQIYIDCIESIVASKVAAIMALPINQIKENAISLEEYAQKQGQAREIYLQFKPMVPEDRLADFKAINDYIYQPIMLDAVTKNSNLRSDFDSFKKLRDESAEISDRSTKRPKTSS